MSPHQIQNALLRGLGNEGPGAAKLTASSSGTQIPDGSMIQFVTPTWSNANYILILPPPVPGRIVIIAGASTGGELRTTSPTTIAINGGTGADAESAIAANKLVFAICESATSWKALGIASDGTVAGIEAAA